MWNADAFSDGAGVMDVTTGTAGALTVDRSAVIVELQRNPDDIVAGVAQQRRRDRRIDTARHGDNHARVGRPALDVKTVAHVSTGRKSFPGGRTRPKVARGGLKLLPSLL